MRHEVVVRNLKSNFVKKIELGTEENVQFVRDLLEGKASRGQIKRYTGMVKFEACFDTRSDAKEWAAKIDQFANKQ